LDENKLKKENGLRFTFPSLSMVLANAIGRGATACCSQACFCMMESSERFKSIISELMNYRISEFLDYLDFIVFKPFKY